MQAANLYERTCKALRRLLALQEGQPFTPAVTQVRIGQGVCCVLRALVCRSAATAAGCVLLASRPDMLSSLAPCAL